jgi:aryl-alcohol dehydrogenase-like predicted oxidoreductase
MEEIEKRFSSATGPMKKLNMISCDSNIPVHSLCLCFVLLSKFIDNAIVGIDSLAQLKQNLDSLKYMGVAKKNFDLIERTLMFHDEKVILPFNWQ